MRCKRWPMHLKSLQRTGWFPTHLNCCLIFVRRGDKLNYRQARYYRIDDQYYNWAVDRFRQEDAKWKHWPDTLTGWSLTLPLRRSSLWRPHKTLGGWKWTWRRKGTRTSSLAKIYSVRRLGPMRLLWMWMGMLVCPCMCLWLPLLLIILKTNNEVSQGSDCN